MEVQGHIATANEFLEAADREFAAGDQLQGSEKLWGAAAHALLSVAMERGWPGHNHQAMRTAVQRLVDEYNDPGILAGFLSAEKFHRNFYHYFMEEFEYPVDRQVVRDFVARLNSIRNTPQA